MFQEVQNEVRLNVGWQVIPGIVQDRGQGFIYGDSLDDKALIAVFSYTLNFAFTTAILLEDQDLFTVGFSLNFSFT